MCIFIWIEKQNRLVMSLVMFNTQHNSNEVSGNNEVKFAPTPNRGFLSLFWSENNYRYLYTTRLIIDVRYSIGTWKIIKTMQSGLSKKL